MVRMKEGRRQEDTPKEERMPLALAVQLLLEECRMVLPGIQALFGFQLIAVFNNRFSELLTKEEQVLHVMATGLVAIAVALIMTPAAFHRQTSPQHASDAFIRISTRLVLWSMLPLAVSLCLEFYLVGRIILGGMLAPILAVVVFAVYVVLWFVLPRSARLQRLLVGKR
jgi:hypothetical protein